MRPEFRDVSINARRTVAGVPEGALPAAEVGPRKSETPSRHRRGNYFQGLRILHHRLPEQGVSGSCQEGSARKCCEGKIFRRKGIKNTHRKNDATSPVPD